MRKSTIFFIFCVAFVIGIASHSFIFEEKLILDPFIWYAGFLFFAIIGLVFRNKKQGIVILSLAFVVLGFFRYSQTIPKIDKNNILRYTDKEVTINGIVSSFPNFKESAATYTFDLDKVLSDKWIELSRSRLILTTELFPKYEYGDLLSITCVPERLNEYEQYYRKQMVSASCSFPQSVALVSKNNGSKFKSFLLSIRIRFDKRLKSIFSDPQGALLAGLLYGDTSGFSKELKQDFRIAGISHITALSGYNVTILARILIILLIFLFLTRRQALPIAFLLILMFVILTGAEASVVRAAIMGFLILGAKGIGRMSKMRVAIALACALMLFFNPYLLRYDLGFQLSFLATIALVWFADDFNKKTWLSKMPEFFGIREAASASAAAILFTAPLIFYATGRLGHWSLLVNILVVPVVPFAMAFGFATILADFLFHPLGIVFSSVANIILKYIIWVAEYFAKFGAIEMRVGLLTSISMFAILIAGIWFWKHRYAQKIDSSGLEA